MSETALDAENRRAIEFWCVEAFRPNGFRGDASLRSHDGAEILAGYGGPADVGLGFKVKWALAVKGNSEQRDRTCGEPIYIDAGHFCLMSPVEAGIHREVVDVDGSGSAGTDEEVRNLNGCVACVGEGDLQINGVGRLCAITRWKCEALGDLKSIRLCALEKDLALGTVGGHFKSAQHLAGIESESANGHGAAAIQSDIVMILSEVHAQDDLLDAAGVVIENKFRAVRAEALSARRHGGRRLGSCDWSRCGRRSHCSGWSGGRSRRSTSGQGLWRVVFTDIPLPGEESGD